jgi:hypothetical protein
MVRVTLKNKVDVRWHPEADTFEILDTPKPTDANLLLRNAEDNVVATYESWEWFKVDEMGLVE